jgi:predicted phage terminase large subunit-like protein
MTQMGHSGAVVLSATDYWDDTVNKWQPLPHQVPPPGDWYVWLLLGGRGSGKTMAGTHFVLDHLRSRGRKARVGIGAPTIADARDVCAEGVTGLISLAPTEFRYNRSMGEAHHKDGGYVKFMGSEEPARWNGPQWSLLWADELALWNEASWHQAQFGLRLGENPRAIVTTTPKNRDFVRTLSELDSTATIRATTYDNPTLSDAVQERLRQQYGGTRIGRQEILAEWLDDVPGALWQWSMIHSKPLLEIPALERIVVAIDPAATANKTSDDTGIMVVGRADTDEYYVLADYSGKYSPDAWAGKAIDAYETHKADRIIGETNNGGDMVEHTLRTVRSGIPYTSVHATRGKRIRAEPIAALYEQGKVFHAPGLNDLEEQLVSWTPDSSGSPDRLDALVWAMTELSQKGKPNIRWITI